MSIKDQPKLILGTDFFKPSIQQDVNQFLDRYIELGGSMIDTAENYGRGASEIAIGQWIRDNNNRKKVQILTKGCHPYDNQHRLSPDAIQTDLEGSLVRLNTDYIDYYALHRDHPDEPVQAIIDTLNIYIKNGQIMQIGVSNWSIDRIQQANAYASENGLAGFTFSSINFSLARANKPRWPGSISIDDRTYEWHCKSQFPIFSWSSLAAGFMSGIYEKDTITNQEIADVYYNSDNWEKLRRAKQLALKHSCHISQIALSYVIHQPFPTAAIVASHRIEELELNMKAVEINLSSEEIQYLNLEINYL